ncbi:hypothetical protein WMF45_44540 [Sorangium sp. So ce448]|uniref:hypothetical protein n=1 Tax=Sorangium sp. So ce448 TaxID=3133314 RepID=UPI003F63A6BA
MKNEWNDALATYDRECSVVEGVRKQYFDFLRATVCDVVRAVDAPLGPPSSEHFELESMEASAQWSDGLLDVDVWPSSPYGGPAGLFRVAMYLQPGLFKGADVPRPSALAVAAGAELAALPGSMFDVEAHPDAQDDARHLLRIDCVPANDVQLRSKLASLVTAYAGARARVVQAMLGPYGWVQLCLRGLLGRPLDAGGRGKWSSKLLDDPWAGGRYVQWQSEPDDDYAWVATLPPDGRVVFGFSGRFEKDTAFHAALCSRLQSAPETIDKCPSGTLLDAAAAREAFERGDRARIVEVALGALRAYYDLADEHAGTT